MSRFTVSLLSLSGFLTMTVSGAGRAAAAAPEGGKIRIGTYDSRAIAIAYAPSKFNPVTQKTADYEKAKAAGDKEKMKELESWGEEHQRQLHFQGFGRVPVDDLLTLVKDKVVQVAKERKLAAISANCEFTNADVELVDITDDLVKLYDPSEKTLEYVKSIRKVKPTPLTQLGRLPAKQ